MQTSYDFWKEHFDTTEEQFKEKLNFWLSLSPSARRKGNLPLCRKNVLAMMIGMTKSQIAKQGGFVAYSFGHLTIFIFNIWLIFMSLNPKNNQKEFLEVDNKYPKTEQLVRENKITCCFEFWMSEELEETEKEERIRKTTDIIMSIVSKRETIPQGDELFQKQS